MEKSGDNELVQATLAGDPTAFGELVARYEKKLFNLALRVTGDAEDAMDATQNAFMRAYKSLGRFDSGYRFFSWIYRISLNESLRVVDRRRQLTSIADDAPATSPTPEDECSGKETGGAIRQALAELTADQRTVVVLRHLHGLSYDEMSEITGVPAKTVKSRLFEARRALRRRLTATGVFA